MLSINNCNITERKQPDIIYFLNERTQHFKGPAKDIKHERD